MTPTVPLTLPEVERRLADAERMALALRKIAEGLRDLGEMNGHAAEFLAPIPTPEPQPEAVSIENVPGVEPDRPRGREAVRLVVGQRPGLWSLSQIVDEMKLRECFTTRKAAEVAVARLIASGEGARTSKKGVYRFPARDPEEVSDESLTAEPSGNGSTMW